MINFELKTPFRFHVGKMGESSDSVRNHIYANRPDTEGVAAYKLFMGTDRLLPFQVFIPYGEFDLQTHLITSIEFVRCDGTSGASQNFCNLFKDQIAIYESPSKGVWLFYRGHKPLPLGGLAGGTFYTLHITISNITHIYSEWFYVPVSQSELDAQTMIEWWNSCDTLNTIYRFGYKNRVYLHCLPESKPTIEETGIENGDGQFVPLGARYIDNYDLQDIIPEYLMHALLAARMHDNVEMSLPNRIQKGAFRISKFTTTPENGGLASIVMTLEQKDLVSKGACCESFGNLTNLNPLQLQGETIVFYKGGYGRWVPGVGYDTGVILPNLLKNDIGVGLIVTAEQKATTSGGEVEIYSDGNWLYTPPTNYLGYDSFTYTVTDEFGKTGTATVTLNVEDVLAQEDYLTVSAQTMGSYTFSLEDNVLANDIFPYGYQQPDDRKIIGNQPSNPDVYIFTDPTSWDSVQIHTITGQVTLIKNSMPGQFAGILVPYTIKNFHGFAQNGNQNTELYIEYT